MSGTTRALIWSSYNSSDLKIRFRSYVSSSREDANIDNVKIVGSGAAASMMASPMMAMIRLQSDRDKTAGIPVAAREQIAVVQMQPAFDSTTIDSVFSEMNSPNPSDSAVTIESSLDLEVMLELLAGEQLER